MASLALSSLVETYTDSEGEETVSMESTPTDSPTQTNQPKPPKPKGLTALVSYLSEDDTIASDDELIYETTTSPSTSSTPSESGSSEASVNQMFMDLDFPPEPTGPCSSDLTEKINNMAELMELNGCDMNQIIQRNKSFRNPSMYEKLISHCDINEYGTNFDPHVYDPLKWNKYSYYDELAKAQDDDERRREEERKVKTTILSGTAKKVTTVAAAVKNDTKKRKSKWDIAVNIHAEPCLRNNPASHTSAYSSTKGTYRKKVKN